MAKKGKSSMGCFFGFKMHFVINPFVQIVSFCLSPGNISDINDNVIDHLTKNIYGKLFGNKGYLSDFLFKKLYVRGIQLFTKIRKNMKNTLMFLEDKIFLKKRGLIKSVFNKLKNGLGIEHSRHKSFPNFIVHALGYIAAYHFETNKPSIINKDIVKLMVY